MQRMGLGCVHITKNNSDIIDYAIQHGIYFFDTADIYENNQSEIELGIKLKKYNREQIFISTKVGLINTEKGVKINGSEDYLRTACIDSLKRLQTDYIDLLYLHRVDPNITIEASIKVLSDLIAEKKVKSIGLSEVTENQIRRAYRICPIHAVQIEYSPWAMQDENNGVIKTCKELNIKIVVYSPLGRAFFTNATQDYFKSLPGHDYRKLLHRYVGENLEYNLLQRKEIQQFADKQPCSLAQLVLAWEMNKGFIVIPGTTNTLHFDENLAASNIHLSKQVYDEFDTLCHSLRYQGKRYPNETISGIYPEKQSSQSNLLDVLGFFHDLTKSLVCKQLTYKATDEEINENYKHIAQQSPIFNKA